MYKELTFDMSLEFVNDFFENFQIQPKKTIVGIANNHSGDKGLNGIYSSYEFLKSIGCNVMGCSSDGNV